LTWGSTIWFDVRAGRLTEHAAGPNEILGTYTDSRPIGKIPDEVSDFVSETFGLGDKVEAVQVPLRNIHVQTIVGKVVDSAAPNSIHQT
jgi:hypothetical protein